MIEYHKTRHYNIQFGVYVIGDALQKREFRDKRTLQKHLNAWAHYKSANLGIKGPYKSTKKVHYKSAKNLPVLL